MEFISNQWDPRYKEIMEELKKEKPKEDFMFFMGKNLLAKEEEKKKVK